MQGKRILWLALLLVAATASQLLAGGSEIKGLKKDLRRALAAEDQPGAIAILKEITAVGGEDAVKALYGIGRKYGNTPEFYKAVLGELARLGETLPFILDKYKKVKSKPDFQERVYIADIASVIDSAEARAGLIEFLEDRSAFVQGVAVKGLEKSMHADAIEPLIELLAKLMKKRKDVLYHQVRDGLFNLTGQDFEIIEDWRSWWAPNKGHFDPKKIESDGKTGVRRKTRGSEPEFFGVPVESKHVVFVIDTSGSMKYVHKDDIPGLARADGSDRGQGEGGGRMTPADQRLAKFWTRMEMAKRELRKVVERMEKDTFFNIVRFDSTVSRFQKKKALPATPGSKKRAQKWIDGMRHNGNTNTLDALIMAFQTDVKTNTIFFLSDGLPSKDGKVDDPTGPILDKVFEMNRFRKIKIHTFGFYPRTQKGQPMPNLQQANRFLKKLAEATGGKYTDMKVDTRFTPENPEGT